MDRTFDFLASEFGLGEIDEKVDIYWLAEASLVERTPCGQLEGAGGCFVDGGEAFVLEPSIAEHELVHLYFAGRVGRTHSFFEEGIAVVYGRVPSFEQPSSDLREALLQGEGLDGVHYARAGHFMSFLLDEYGPDVVGRFFEGAEGVRELSGIEPVFSAVFGESLEEFITRYESTAPGCGSAGWNRPVDCEAEPQPWAQPWAWERRFSLDCDDEDVVRGVNGRFRTRAPLQVSEAATHTLFLDGPVPIEPADAYQVRLLSCGGCEEELSFTINAEMGSLSRIPLEPGRYLVDVSRDPEAPPGVSVRLTTP